jgi:hypothetical protein
MKTFTATDARNKFGEFLDSGMVEGVKVVRNNRILGYFVPERQYEDLKRAAMAGDGQVQARPPELALSPPQAETLNLYSQGMITSTEAKADLGVDRRGLIDLMARQGLLLPHIERSRAEEMARESLSAMGMSAIDQDRDRAAAKSVQRG